MADPDYEFTSGDVPIPLIMTLRDGNDDLVDFTDATNIVFSMRNRANDVLKIDHATATVEGLATAGELSYAWTSDDGDTPGDYDAQADWDKDGNHYFGPTNPKLWIRVLPAVAESLPYRGAYRWIRELLGKTFSQMPDSRLQMWVESAIAKLRGRWSTLPAYAELDADDLTSFDEALGFLVAAKLRPMLGKSVPTTEIVRIHTQNTHFEYARPKMPGVTLEEQWLRWASEALSRVSIFAAIRTTQAAVSWYQAAGPRRAQQARGVNTHSFENPLRTILADEWDYQAQNPIWWQSWS